MFSSYRECLSHASTSVVACVFCPHVSREAAMSVLELAVDSVVGSVAVTCSAAGLMVVVEATTITITVPFRESSLRWGSECTVLSVITSL